MFYRYFLLCLLPWCLYAGLQEHFHKIVDKSDGHSLGNIDFIYMINLDERPEKYADSLGRLLPYGIVPYRFSAVNGWKLSFEEVEELGSRYHERMGKGHWGTYYPREYEWKPCHEVMAVAGRSYYGHCMPRGAIGILLSHLSILQDAWDAGYETIWVMEDDVDVVEDPRVLPKLVRELDMIVGKDGWDILFTDPDTKGQDGKYVACSAYAWRPDIPDIDLGRFVKRERIGRKFVRVGARYGAYSMIVRRSGIEKLLEFFKQRALFLPYDMEYTLPKHIRLFSLSFDVVTTLPKAISDNGSPNFLKKKGG